jgi:hypothetical protein
VTRDVRHEAIVLLERELGRAGCDTAQATAAHLLVVLEGHQIGLSDIRALGDPTDWHTQPTGSQPTDDYRAARAKLAATRRRTA